jgi:hypothetical protein
MYSEEQKAAWSVVARLQGIVCLVCGEPPKLQNRHVFYDSGLCRVCAADIDDAPDRIGDPGLA